MSAHATSAAKANTDTAGACTRRCQCGRNVESAGPAAAANRLRHKAAGPGTARPEGTGLRGADRACVATRTARAAEANRNATRTNTCGCQARCDVEPAETATTANRLGEITG